MQFAKATKKKLYGRFAIIGQTGGGKTYTGLAIASSMCMKLAVGDTESKSASKYADIFNFDVLELEEFSPQNYIALIETAEAAGYDGLLIDSLSHAWAGRGGALEMVDAVAKRQQAGNNFAAWREVTPWHNKLIDKMIRSRLHLFVTMRSKMEYVMERGPDGRTVVRKVGLQPIQRDGMEYEFDVVGDVDSEHTLVITKSRCPQLANRVFPMAGSEVATIFKGWLDVGVPMAPESDPSSLPITDDQYSALVAKSRELSIDPEAVKAVLRGEFHVEAAKALTQGQLKHLLARLPALQEKEAA